MASKRLLRHAGALLALMTFLATTKTALSADVDPALVAQGRYLAIAADCGACHTAPGGTPMAGGLAVATPIGSIISTNITPSKSAGIGNYTLEQFSDALRRGVRADRKQLYPAMPYTAYAKITDGDIKALYSYFMLGVAPVDKRPPQTHLPFPFDIRLSMKAWNLLFLDTKPFAPDPAKDAEWNRGAYLALSLGHCGTCHTPRNLLMAENHSRLFAGGDLGTWFAPNITSDPNSGIGAWSVDDLVSYMRDGRAPGKGQAAGPMAEAVDQSLRHLHEGDLKALAAYLLTVPPIKSPAATRPPSAWGAPGGQLAAIRGVTPPQDQEQWSGPQLYDGYCATCHQAAGQGSFDGRLPSLFHNTTLGRPNSANLVMAILEGVHREPDVDMPGFARQLSDRDVATLGNYLLQQYGNPTAKVTVDEVKTLRAGGVSADWLIWVARIGIAVIALIIIAIVIVLGFLVARRRRTMKSV
ncbi:MAG: c-type cytochrome [Acetobacteraceae bacterium]